MSTSTRRRVAFVVSLSTVVGMSGFLLNAAPPHAVGTWEVRGTTDPSSARTGAATATLANGSTLIAGGRLGDGSITDSVVVYDPMTNDSTVVGYLVSPRVNAAAARLDDGRVLVAGGEVGELLSADMEIFDPSTGTSSAAPSLTTPRTRHAAARLADGKVLIVGGATVDGVVVATTELFDPATGNMLAAGSMATPRAGATATLLIDNRVLVAGGNNGAQDLASAELYYPTTDAFFSVDTQLSTARAGHTAVLLPHNGAVLIAGGAVAGAQVNTTDLFLPTMFPDPYTWSMGTFGPAEQLTHARTQAVSGPMGDDGYAFVAGGGSPHDEAYAFTTIKTDRDDYAPGEAAVITGSGWQPYEEVTLVFQEDPAVHADYMLTLTADGDGKIFHDTWAPEQHDANVRFYLTATGVRSLRRAQMTFTDSVTSVTITSPTSASPVAVAQGASFTVSFSYVTSASGTTRAKATLCQANNCNGSNTIAMSEKDVTLGTSSDSIVITVPVGASAGSDYGVEVEVRNDSGNGSIVKTDRQKDAVSVTGSAAAATTTSLTAPAIFYGANGSVTVSVAPTSGSSTPTGDISLSVDGGTAVSRTLVAGSYTFTSTDIAALATPNAGGHSLSASYAGAAGFVASTAIGTLTVQRAPTVTTVTIVGEPFFYTGAAQTPATVTVTGPGGLNLTPAASYVNNVNAGTATASYSYPGDSNYAESSDSENFIIAKAPTVTTVTIDGEPFFYTGAAQTPATVTVTGPGGLNLTPAASYVNNVNAGTATASYSYPGDSNYAESSDSENFIIAKAPTVTTVTIVGEPFFYTGAAQTPATVTVTGPGGLNLTPAASYVNNVNAGTATASYSYPGDSNYAESSDSENFIIAKAPTVTTVTIVGEPFFYTGAAQTPATVTVTGPGGLNLTPAASYVNNVNAGTATASYSYPGDSNYAESSDSENFIIAKAPTVTTVTIVGEPFFYTGAAQTPATVTVTGPGGLNLTPAASYVNNVNAGTATASYSYPGDSNYAESSDLENFIIAKAPTVTTVTIDGEPFFYTGAAQTPATVTVTGPGGLNLTPAASYVNNVNAGTATASYSYPGDSNYAESSDSENFIIAKAPTVTTVTIDGEPFFYTGAAQTPATVTVTGPGGLNLTPAASYVNNVNAGTATASYNYPGDANYDESSDSESFTIDPKPVTWTTKPSSKIYGNSDPAPLTTGYGTGFLVADGVTAAYGRAAGDTVALSPYHITAMLSATGSLSNYAITNVGANFTINPRPLTITANSFNKLLGATYTFLGSEFGTDAMVAGDSVTSVTLASAGAAAGATVVDPGPHYAIVPSLAVGIGLSNYAISYADGTMTVVYATTGMCLGSPGHQVLQPLNIDGTSVVKKGSTVPVKFRVCDANGNSIGTAGVVTDFQLVQIIENLVPHTVTEDPSSTTPDAAFRWSPSDQQWIFNLSTKNLANGKTYVYRITLNDESTITFQFGTKQ